MKDEVSRNIVENYKKFKTKTKDEVSSFNHNSSKNEIFCNPGAKIIYGDSGVISLHHHRRTSWDPTFRLHPSDDGSSYSWTQEYDWSLLNKVRPLELHKGPTSLSRSALISRITATGDRIPTEEDIYLLILSSLDYGCSTDPPSDRDNNVSHSRGIPSKTAPPGEG